MPSVAVPVRKLSLILGSCRLPVRGGSNTNTTFTQENWPLYVPVGSGIVVLCWSDGDHAEDHVHTNIANKYLPVSV